MSFTANVGETVVDLNTGAKFKVADAPMDLDETKYGRVQGSFNLPKQAVDNANQMFSQAHASVQNAVGEMQANHDRAALLQSNPQAAVNNEVANPSPTPTPIAANPDAYAAIHGAGQKQAGQEAANFNQKAMGAAIPTVAAATGFVPALSSIPLQMGIQGGAEALRQYNAGEPMGLGKIAAAAAVPYAAKKVVDIGKGAYTALGKFVAPAAVRQAGAEAAIENVGATGNNVSRAYEVPGSKTAYAAAEAEPPLSARQVSQAFKQESQNASKAIAARPARKAMNDIAENIHPKVTPPEVENAGNIADFIANKKKATDTYMKELAKRPSEVGWKQVIDEAQSLRSKAHDAYELGNNVAGDAYRTGADNIVAKLEKVNPKYAEANKLYLREQGINKVAETLTKPGAGDKIGLLFSKDPLTKAAFSESEAKMFEDVGRYLSSIGATGSPYSGFGGRVLDAMATPIAHMVRSPTGMYLMKQTFKNGVTPQGIAVLAQFGRAYNAQENK